MTQTILKENELDAFFKSLNKKNILLVRGEKSYSLCGAESWLDNALKESNVISFCGFQVNPEISDLNEGIKLFKKTSPAAVIAVGGGSVLDMGKMIRFFGSIEKSPDAWLDGDQSLPVLEGICPLIAIPTTSGTGAEATHFAVLYRDKTKYSVAHPTILPEQVILKPELTLAMSPYLCAVTGMDAFCQALEAWWSRNHTEESRQYSEEAMNLVLENLSASVSGDKQAREAMQKAAWLGGKAINIAKTTAIHAFSYILTSRFGLPHGHALCITLPFFMDYNLKNMNGQDAERLRALLGISKGQEKEWMMDFIDSIKIDRKLQVRRDELNDLFNKNVNLERLKNNPVEVTEKVIGELVRDCV